VVASGARDPLLPDFTGRGLGEHGTNGSRHGLEDDNGGDHLPRLAVELRLDDVEQPIGEHIDTIDVVHRDVRKAGHQPEPRPASFIAIGGRLHWPLWRFAAMVTAVAR
jgi:hypothetical protein